MKRFFILALILVIGLTACASESEVVDLGEPAVARSGIEIYQPWVRSVAMKADSGDGAHSGTVTGAFMLIKNTTSENDTLVSASTDMAAQVEIHETTMKDDVMSMAEVSGIDIPANGQVELKPGGYHIMLIGVKQALKEGQTVTLRLVFQNAGQVTVEAEVRKP